MKIMSINISHGIASSTKSLNTMFIVNKSSQVLDVQFGVLEKESKDDEFPFFFFFFNCVGFDV